jgi:hypothetical protein
MLVFLFSVFAPTLVFLSRVPFGIPLSRVPSIILFVLSMAVIVPFMLIVIFLGPVVAALDRPTLRISLSLVFVFSFVVLAFRIMLVTLPVLLIFPPAAVAIVLVIITFVAVSLAFVAG